MTYTEHGTRVEVPLPAELAQAHPITLMIDRQDRVWVGTDFGMIGVRDVDGTWILFSPEEYGSDSTRQIIMDGQGRVWARSHRGPAQLDPASGDRTIRYGSSAMPNSDAVALATDPQGQLWALTTQREVKVLEDNGNWRTVVIAPATVRNGFMDAFLTFDPHGQMWLATVQGVGALSPDGAWKEHPLGDPYRSLSLYGVMADDKGRVWVAAFQPSSVHAESFSGLFRFDPQTGWMSYDARDSGVRADVNAVAPGQEGGVWIGSSQGGVSKFSPEGTLPVQSLSIVRAAAGTLVPIALLSTTLLALWFLAFVRPPATAMPKKV
jgi:ligand-binding sensor domain-containing protein